MKKYARVIASVLTIVILIGCSHPETDDNTPVSTVAPVTETPVPTEVAVPTENLVPTEITKPTETQIPTEIVEPMESPEPTEMVEPTESPEPTEVAEPTEIPEPTEEAEPTESPEPTEVAEPTESPEPTEVAEPTESLEPTEVAEPTESPEPTEVAEPTESPEPTEVAEPTESPEPTEVAEPTESPEPTEVAEPKESPEPTEIAEPTEAPEPTEITEPTESPEPIEDAEITESPEPTEVAEVIEPTNTPLPSITPEIIPSPTLTPTPIPTSKPTPTLDVTPKPTSKPVVTKTPDNTENDNTMTELQMNSLTMLNYLAYVSTEINLNRKNRVYLDYIYDILFNDINPDKIDKLTKTRHKSITDTIHDYKMIDIKRDRLKYIYEQNQAKAFRSAIPNPLSLLSSNIAGSPIQMLSSIIYMGVDSVSSYNAYCEEAELEFLKNNWELDDKEMAVMHKAYQESFGYMVDIVNSYNIDGLKTLNQDQVEEFIKKTQTDYYTRIAFLEANRDTYKLFVNYWLELIRAYYEHGDYQKCVDTVEEYEKIKPKIFRKDIEYAKALTMVISAIDIIFTKQLDAKYTKSKYCDLVSKYLTEILNNININDWSLKFFVAQTYLKLYGFRPYTHRYIETAYQLIKQNVTYLKEEQRDMNKKYLSELKEEKINEADYAYDETGERKKKAQKEIDEYNDGMEEIRKKELPPVYEPLYVNCELLLSLMDKLEVSDDERRDINGLLFGVNNEDLFFNKIINDKIRRSSTKNITVRAKEFDGDPDWVDPYFIIPVWCVSDSSIITVTVTDNKNNVTVFNDWVITEVIRNSNNINNIYVKYSSDKMDPFKWPDASRIKITIKEEISDEVIEINYKQYYGTGLLDTGFLKRIHFEQE